MFELEGVRKRFGDTVAVDGVDLRVPPGETLALLGPSGCGKSTLLRLMIGLERPDAGTVRFDGVAVDPRHAAALRRRLGYVVQGGGLFPHLTARQNACLLVEVLRWDPERIAQRLSALMAMAQLPDEVLSRFPAELSGGQRQRISLVRALMHDPDVLLLDEPLGALDPITRSELQADLKDAFARLGKTVVLVTHDLGEAAFLSERIVLLRDGRIVQTGSMRELLEKPADPFVTRFVRAHRSPLDGLEVGT